MKYVLIWCSGGTGTVVVDEQAFPMQESQVITITSGQFHYLKNTREITGLALEFTYDFFIKNDQDLELIFHNGLFCHFAMNEIITISNPACFQEQLVAIRKEIEQKPYQYLTSIHSRIELLLVQINREKVAQGEEIYHPDALFLKFLNLVRANFEKNYSAVQCAELLGTTESKLNELSKLHTGKTAQNVIYGLIVSEAKCLFLYQDFSVKEVAYQLGFNDQFYFSRFFKKHTAISPIDYRKSLTTS